MSNGDPVQVTNQEDYLSSTSVPQVLLRGVKKLVTEVSSMKTLAMFAFVGLNYVGKMDSIATVIGVLGCVGAKEIDFTQVTEIIKQHFGQNK